jgi:prepilin-type processing-associated H-X9-DG protein
MNTHSHPPFSEPASTHSNQDPQAGAGFSQVDLLTVIVVLMLLGLLLTPALARNRAADLTLQCRNNLRQLIHGWRLYAEDNSGNLPNCFDWVTGGQNYTANYPDNTNINYLIHGLLGPYVTNPAVYKCPADQSQAIEGGVKLPRVRSYSMSQSFCNANEGHLEDGDSPPNYWRHYTHTTNTVAPGPVNLWVLLDENPDSLNDGAFAVAMSGNSQTTTKWQDGPSTLHDGGCSFAFADGHYEIKKWTDPRTLALKTTYTAAFPYGISQPSNPDIKWLRERTTAPK